MPWCPGEDRHRLRTPQRIVLESQDYYCTFFVLVECALGGLWNAKESED